MAADGRGRPHRSRPVPFVVLQAVELLALVALVDLSLHVDRGGVLVAAGAAYAVLALTADGPLGVARWCSRPLHVRLVVVVSVVVALTPLVPALRPDLEGILTLEVVAVGLLRLATLTATGRPGASPAVRAEAGPEATTTTADAGLDDRVAAAARRAGRLTGAAAEAASRTAARHGPAVRARASRAIREAGRVAGRAADRMAGPSDRTPPES